jgi:hypothetical protein
VVSVVGLLDRGSVADVGALPWLVVWCCGITCVSRCWWVIFCLQSFDGEGS